MKKAGKTSEPLRKGIGQPGFEKYMDSPYNAKTSGVSNQVNCGTARKGSNKVVDVPGQPT